MPLYLIVLLPLLGFVINGLFGAKLPRPVPGVIATVAVGLAFIVAVLRFAELAAGGAELSKGINETAYTWMQAGSFSAEISFLLDRLSGVMILVVTGIGTLIHLYSIGYMAHDDNDPEHRLYARYFSFLNLFIAFMATLVLADNYLLMFVGWEGVGLCSYFLIGFWNQREDAAEASKKAFIMNRVGDFAFLLGLMLIFLAAGTLKYADVFAKFAENPQLFSLGVAGAVGGVGIVTLLLFIGAAGKSAQVPLYTWLPDAMAGPTPVSALIHAATMVTAGVYLCARSAPLFDASPTTRMIVCGIGTLTALAAGLTALAHTDIKKVLAYSTVSQLGFMFMAIGSGAYVAAIFHVFTHAFFKACLFLGAGSVIHSLHGEQDMRKMGGLATKMKATHITFLISGLALAGVVPFAGFFSKDEIIAEVFRAGSTGGSAFYMICGAVGLLTAFITALYTGRQYAQIFGGTPRDEHLFEHAHESPAVMTIPLYILAVGATFAGFLGVPHIPGVPEALHGFANWLSPLFHAEGAHGGEVQSSVNWALLGLGVLIGLGGWFLGRGLGLKQGDRAALPESTSSLSLDAIYRAVFGKAGLAFAGAVRWFDDRIIDGIVNGVGSVVGLASDALRLTQTSFVRNYALAMALGAAVVLGFFLQIVLKS